MNKKEGLTIFAHPSLLYGGVIGCSFIALLGFVPLLIELIGGNKDLFVGIFMAIMGLLMIVGIVMCLPRWYVKITFGTDKVIFKQAFKKKTEHEYRTYRYVYRASYLHMLYRPQYLVFSQTRLSESDLQNINNIPPSEKIIKIRYRKKIFQKLYDVLPSKQRIEMANCFPEIKSEGEI